MAMVTLLVLAILAVEFAPPKWVAKHAQRAANDRTNASVSIAAVDLHVIGLNPSVRVSGLSVSHDESPDDHAQAQITSFSGSVRLTELLTGNLYINELTVNEGSVSAAIDANGQGNWLYLLPSDATDVSEAESTEENSTLVLPVVEKLAINDMQINLNDEQRSIDAQLQINSTGSTANPSPATLTANGTVNALPANLDIVSNLLSALASEDERLTLDIDAQVGDSQLSVEGYIASLDSIQGAELLVSTSAQGLGDVEVLTGLTLPVVPEFTLSGTLLFDNPEIVLQRFDGTFGDSDIQGDVRLNPTTTPINVFANVISRRLDLDDLAGFIGSEPDPTETASGQQDDEAIDDASDARLLPSDPIALATLASAFNGAIDFRADAISSAVWPVQSMDTRIEVEGTDVAIDPLQIDVADGRVTGSLIMDTAATPVQTEVTIRIDKVDIKPFLSKIDIDDDSFGLLGGRVKYWVEGQSVADMAASADGGLFLLMTQGKLDSLLAELAGVDFLESLTVLIDPEQSRTDINCAYLDLQSDDGVSDIATLVLDTDDAVILADGTIDMNDESLDIVVEPHPKDISILAAQTAAHIEGTLGSPSITPGRTLYARAAAAAILASIATPAATLIPFIESGTGNDSAYCEGMITALDDARE